MKNYPAFLLGLFGLVVMFLLVAVAVFGHSINPAYITWAGVTGALMGGELILLGMGKRK